jgi:hypothetical protein
VVQLTDLDAMEANAKRDNRKDSVRSDPPKPGLVEQSPHKEILALGAGDRPRAQRIHAALAANGSHPVAAEGSRIDHSTGQVAGTACQPV